MNMEDDEAAIDVAAAIRAVSEQLSRWPEYDPVVVDTCLGLNGFALLVDRAHPALSPEHLAPLLRLLARCVDEALAAITPAQPQDDTPSGD